MVRLYCRQSLFSNGGQNSYPSTLYLFAIVAFSWSTAVGGLTLEFRRTGLCFLKEKIRLGYTRVVSNVDKSTLSCSRLCQVDETCVGFSVTTGKIGLNHSLEAGSTPGLCYLHEEYLTNEKCMNPDPAHAYYRKYGVCYNGGVWNAEELRCLCDKTKLMVGPLCTAIPRNCRDLSNAGIRPLNKDVYIKPVHSEDKFLKRCNIAKNGMTVTEIAYNTKTVNEFNRTWADYENGFVEKNTLYAYWIGLRRLRAILQSTVEPSTFYVEVAAIAGLGVAVFGYAEYYGVDVSDASDGYRLNYSLQIQYGKFLKGPGHCLEYSNGAKFSTFDSDNDDNVTDNCAALNGMGWWFGARCDTPCNLFGSKYTYNVNMRTVAEPYTLAQMRGPGLTLYKLYRLFVYAKIQVRA